jgi:hypothetical protein
MLERDAAKIATLLVVAAILVNIGLHGQVFTGLANVIRQIWLNSLSIAAGGSGKVA